MPLTAVNFVTKGPVLHNDLLQFFNLFTGVMVDQPVTFKNILTLGGNQGTTTVPLKLYGAVGQTSHLLDLYTDNTNANPGWGIAASGLMAWGPGGAAPTDTTLSRVAVQNGHSTDTAGLLITPYLDVAGSMQVNGALTFKTSGAVINQGSAGSLLATINQDLQVNRMLVTGTPGTYPGYNQGIAVQNNGVGYGIVVQPNINASSGQPAGVYSNPIQTVSNPNNIEGYIAAPQTAAAAITVGAAIGFHAYGVTKGSGSTLNYSYGMYIEAQNQGSTQNIGINIVAPTGGSGQAIGIQNYGFLAQNNGMRVSGVQFAPAGVGIEINHDGTVNGGGLQSYNRSTSSWTDLVLAGRNVNLSPQGGSLIIPNGSITTAYLAGNAATQPYGNQGFGAFGGVAFSTSSTSPVPVGIAVSLTTTGQPVLLILSFAGGNNTVNAIINLYIYQDGVAGPIKRYTQYVANTNIGMDLVAMFQPAAGAHTWAAYLAVNTGTFSADSGTSALIYAIEFKR